MAKIIEKKFRVKWYHIILVKYWWLLIILIFLIVFLSEYFLLVKPKLDQTKNGHSLDVKFYKQLLSDEKVYLAKLKKFKTKTDTINSTNLSKLDEVIANNSNVTAVLQQIYQIMSNTDMKLTSLGIKEDEGEIIIQLGLKGGTYQKFKEFLGLIENNIRIMDITNLSLAKAGENFSLTIKTYFKK